MTRSSSTHAIAVHHVEVHSTLPVMRIHERLLSILPRLDPKLVEALVRGDVETVERQRREGPPLWLFEVRDMGALVTLEGRTARSYQYEIGNPLTAESMVRHHLGAGLYAPLRVVLYEDRAGSVLAYDSPSDLFGQFGDERVAEVGQELERELEALLSEATSASSTRAS